MAMRYMDNLGDISARLARNPLGIIGLAFVLVYGVAGYAATSDMFQDSERRLLVYFLVLFPVLIIGVFYKLVTAHHTKLYAPSDFRNDAAFLQSLDARISNSPKVLELEEVTEQIRQQIEGQPLYKYTKLSECGKLLALSLNRSSEIDLEERKAIADFDAEEIESQINRLVEYGWAVKSGNNLHRTDKGKAELDTFIDLAYGRLS